ncbi:LCP family protein (plasmid) [Streptomyces sp. CA-294286]|uniref:LCP family protein n=1 Tax=Streptomyces sp. CA-294286 TaxID=3240070 RepID=UPI003D926EA9
MTSSQHAQHGPRTRRTTIPPGRRPGGPRGGGGRRRRPARGRLRLLLTVALALTVLGTAGAGWLYLKLSGNIETFGSDGIADDRPDAAAVGGKNVLVIGSDARTGGNRGLGGGDSDDVGRSDTAFLLHVYADHRHAVAVSVPRDTLVTVPACRLPDGSWTEERRGAMFNTAYSVGQTPQGNPACTQNTVEKLSGLRVDHTVVVDFKGFAELTDVVGGVQVCLPADVYERDLNPHRATRGERLFRKGVQEVRGQQALDYVRLRHGLGDGSDIGRIKRQQAFVSGLLKKVKEEGFTPTKLLPLADAATRSLTVDPGLGSADRLLSFALSLKDIELSDTKFVTVPWKYEGNRVAVVEPDATALWTALREDRTLDGHDAGGEGGPAADPHAAPSSDSRTGTAGSGPRTPDSGTAAAVSGAGARVALFNGTTTDGLAARAAELLSGHGFTVSTTSNAADRNASATTVRYGPGRESDAGKLVRLLPGATALPVPDAGLDVVLGADFARSAAQPASAPQPTAAPSRAAREARSADQDLCSDLSYG